MSSTLAVLLVVDDPALAPRIAEAAARSIQITPLLDPLELLEALSDRAYDVVVLDEDVLAAHGGLVLARALREREEHRRVGIVLRGPRRVDAHAIADVVVADDASAESLYRAIREAGRRCRERLSEAC